MDRSSVVNVEATELRSGQQAQIPKQAVGRRPKVHRVLRASVRVEVERQSRFEEIQVIDSVIARCQHSAPYGVVLHGDAPRVPRNDLVRAPFFWDLLVLSIHGPRYNHASSWRQAPCVAKSGGDVVFEFCWCQTGVVRPYIEKNDIGLVSNAVKNSVPFGTEGVSVTRRSVHRDKVVPWYAAVA